MLRTLDPNAIDITAGNDAVIDITPIDDETELPIVLTNTDTILFTVQDNFGNTLIQKTLTADDYSGPGDTSVNCVLTPADTIDIYPGVYKYDCMLRTSNLNVTFISSTIQIKEALGKYTDGG